MLKRFIGSLLICLISLSFVDHHAEGAIYKVIVYNDGEETAQALGFWVAEDIILTSSAILDWGDQFFVEDPNTGTRYLATRRSSSGSMAFLSVQGLSISTLVSLSAEPPQPNTTTHFPLLDGTKQSGLLSFEDTSDSLFTHRYRFTMDVDSTTLGAPLMNRCDQVISVVSGQLDSDGLLVGVSESYEALVSFLRSDSVAFTLAPIPCPTVEDQLSIEQLRSASLLEDLDSLQNELKSLEDSSAASLDQSAEQLTRLTAQKSILQRRIADTEAMLAKQDSVLNESERLRATLDSLRERNAESQDQLMEQESRNRERLLLLGGIAGALILIGSILLFVFWKRKHDAEEELLDKDDELRKAEEVIERKSLSFSDIILYGLGPHKEEVRIKISGNALAQSEQGLILGRSSKADLVIVESSVSRRHACMSLLHQTIMIHDLKSLNGTVVDGVKLTPGQKQPLAQGSRIQLGDVALTMIIH